PKSAAPYRLARDIYRQYLDTFPQSESAGSMRFYYAEILYALEEWDAAATEYGKVVEAEPKGSQAQRAAYNAILALEKAVAIAKGKLKKRELADAAKVEERKDKGHVDRGAGKLRLETVTRDVQPEPIPENEQKLIAASDSSRTASSVRLARSASSRRLAWRRARGSSTRCSSTRRRRTSPSPRASSAPSWRAIRRASTRRRRSTTRS